MYHDNFFTPINTHPAKMMFVYVFSPFGKLDTTPCKVGFSCQPGVRIKQIKSEYEQATKDYEIAVVYEVKDEPTARQVERDIIEAVSDRKFKTPDYEWVRVPARRLMSILNKDERVRLYLEDFDGMESHRLNAEVSALLYNQFRTKLDRDGRTVAGVIRQVLRKYVEEEDTSWLFGRF